MTGKVVTYFAPKCAPGPGEECESCGQPAAVEMADGSTWCAECDAAATRLGYDERPAELTAAGLFVAGDIVRACGAWRTGESIDAASGGRLHLRFVDGTEVVAERAAERYVVDRGVAA